MMLIKKEIFVGVLELLENEGIIDRIDYPKNKNTVKVTTKDAFDEEFSLYFDFNDMNFLISPEIKRCQQKLERLEEEKQELLEQIRKLGGNA